MVGPQPTYPRRGCGVWSRHYIIQHDHMQAKCPWAACSPHCTGAGAGCSLHVITCCIILCRAHTPHYPFVGVCGLPPPYIYGSWVRCMPQSVSLPLHPSGPLLFGALLAWRLTSCSPQVCPKHIQHTNTYARPLAPRIPTKRNNCMGIA